MMKEFLNRRPRNPGRPLRSPQGLQRPDAIQTLVDIRDEVVESNRLTRELLTATLPEVPAIFDSSNPEGAIPMPVERLVLNASSARINEQHSISGETIVVLEQPSASTFTVRLNTSDAEPIDLSRYSTINLPFNELYISNLVGRGTLELLILRTGSVTPRQTGRDELAVRLGSTVSHDRRGEVIHIEDFEHGLHGWAINGNGGDGSSVVLSSLDANKGRFSMYMTAGSTGPLNQNVEKRIPAPILSQTGIELAFKMDSLVIDTFRINLLIYDGAALHQGSLRWVDKVAPTHTLDILNSDGSTFDNVATSISLPVRSFSVFKLVINPSNNQYVRAILNNTEYDLSGNDLFSSLDTTDPHILIALSLTARSGENDAGYIDDIILTTKEP